MTTKPLPPIPNWNPTSSIRIQPNIHDGSQRVIREEENRFTRSNCEATLGNQSTHYTQGASYSPAPPSYHTTAHSPLSRLIIPSPFQYGIPRPRPPRPVLRFDHIMRPHVRFRGSATSPTSASATIHQIDTDCQAKTSGSSLPNTPQDDNQYRRASKIGLGIPDAPFRPDQSPIRSPATEILANAEKGESKKYSSNVAQRIEKKLVHYSHSGNTTQRWLLEILSWMLSAACMTAIVITLYHCSGKPSPSDWPLSITMNTYISTLSRVSSAALLLPISEALGQLKWHWFQKDSKKIWDFELFDNASRGPWGSFQLLLRTKGTTLAALGAAITIFALALDPFFQQVVVYPQGWVFQQDQCRIPIARRYDPPDIVEMVGTRKQSQYDHNLQPVISQYLLDFGFHETKVGNINRPEISVLCPFGNCTWSPYETLGVCSQCVDVADMLELTCRQGPLDWVRNSTSFTPYQNGTMCGWFFNATSDKPMLMSGYQLDPSTNETLEILTTRNLPLITNLNRRRLFMGSINFGDIRNPLADFVVVTPAVTNSDSEMIDSIRRHDKPVAHECVLSMCVKRMNSSYTTDGYSETVIHNFVNKTQGPFPWTQVSANIADHPELVVYYYLQNITINPAEIGGEQNSTVYGISNNTAFSILSIFDDYFPSFGIYSADDEGIIMKYKTTDDEPHTQPYTKNPWLRPHDVADHVDKLATSMTNAMRSNSNDYVDGTSYKSMVLIKVRWFWLSLPLSLLVLTLVFLLATIVRTSYGKNNVGIWKNSAIANLIYGLPESQKQKILNSSHGCGTPRTRAKTLNARMLPTKGWRISGITLSVPSPKVESERSKNQAPPGWI